MRKESTLLLPNRTLYYSGQNPASLQNLERKVYKKEREGKTEERVSKTCSLIKEKQTYL